MGATIKLAFAVAGRGGESTETQPAGNACLRCCLVLCVSVTVHGSCRLIMQHMDYLVMQQMDRVHQKARSLNGPCGAAERSAQQL